MKEEKPNSDTKAKNAFKQMIKKAGYTAEDPSGSFADVAAKIGKDTVYFEIKKTRITERKGVIFGAATLNEWQAAMTNPQKYFFVLAIEKESEKFDFYIISPKDFMKYSYIPSIKIDFHIPYEKEDKGKLKLGIPGRKKESCVMQKESHFKIIQNAWAGIKESMKLTEVLKKMMPTDDFKPIGQLETYLKH